MAALKARNVDSKNVDPSWALNGFAAPQCYDKLVEAAKAGATIKELHEAIVAIVDLASTIGETKSAFETEKQ